MTSVKSNLSRTAKRSADDGPVPSTRDDGQVGDVERNQPPSEEECDGEAAAGLNDVDKSIPVDIPVFLQNTYRMIDTTDPDIATWSADGTTFLIKDPERLASEVIPLFFKHNKFSSFVRQLNFYGFRKVKIDPFKLNLTPEESRSWRFRHEFFIRGSPCLLRKIRRPNQTTVERGELDALKKEVKDLRTQLTFLARHYQQTLRNGGVGLDRHLPAATTTSYSANEGNATNGKRRRISPHPSPTLPNVSTAVATHDVPYPVSSYGFDPSPLSDGDLLVEDFPSIHNVSDNEGSDGVAHVQQQQQQQRHQLLAPDEAISSDFLPPPPTGIGNFDDVF